MPSEIERDLELARLIEEDQVCTPPPGAALHDGVVVTPDDETAQFVSVRQLHMKFMESIRAGLTVTEVPVTWEAMPGSKVRLVRDTLRSFREVFRLRKLHR